MYLKGRLGLESARIPHADRHGMVWLAYGNLTVRQGTLTFDTAGFDDVPAGRYDIPFQAISFVLLGPGTTVSHDALRLMARHHTGLFAIGEDSVRLYASLPKPPDQSKRARRHAELWGDARKRLDVVRRMYAWRLGELVPSADIAVLRGIEGARAREMYKQLAAQYGVTWRGRRYDREKPELTDRPNQAINHAAVACYAAANVAVNATGCIPQLGFIHEDSGEAFALDIADLFRDTFTLPVAFEATKMVNKSPDDLLERTVRKLAAREIRRAQLVPTMIARIKELLDADDPDRDQERP
ncbi:MAG: type I-E CRISPR-associated endonuclease Cas1e [Polyangiales bacterium]|nr:type I-E CRISPR-associated endonuclease Cas1 [Sandaracinaceae bacterium]